MSTEQHLPSTPAPPFAKEQYREAIDAHKANRMANPWKQHAYDHLTQGRCIGYWIEQIGDAELYEERWLELEAERLAGKCRACDGSGSVFEFDTGVACGGCGGTGEGLGAQ